MNKAEKQPMTPKEVKALNLTIGHPKELILNIHAVTGWKLNTEQNPIPTPTKTIDPENSRPVHGRVPTPENVLAAIKEIHNNGIISKHAELNQETGKYQIPPATQKEIERALIEFRENKMNERPVFMIIPFHNEPTTVAKNLQAAKKWVGPEHTIGISTGRENKKSEENALSTGLEVQKQADEFNLWGMKWDKLKKISGIDNPTNSGDPIDGSKGLTELAGIMHILRLAVKEGHYHYDTKTHKLIKNKKVYVGTHDSDIDNPEEYFAMPLMLLPITKEEDPTNSIYMTMMANTKKDRNNQTILSAINRAANSKDKKINKFGYILQSMSWPLTGERLSDLDELKRMVTLAGMGYETSINSHMAGKIAAEENGSIIKVFNPNLKKEDKPSTEPREYSVLYPCEDMMDAITEHIGAAQKYPHQWSIEDIQSFNQKHKYDIKIYALPPGESAFSNESGVQKMDYLLPSIDQMLSEGIITFPEKNKEKKIESSKQTVILPPTQIFPNSYCQSI